MKTFKEFLQERKLVSMKLKDIKDEINKKKVKAYFNDVKSKCLRKIDLVTYDWFLKLGNFSVKASPNTEILVEV